MGGYSQKSEVEEMHHPPNEAWAWAKAWSRAKTKAWTRTKVMEKAWAWEMGRARAMKARDDYHVRSWEILSFGCPKITRRAI